MRKFALVCGLALGCSLGLTGKGYAADAPPVMASEDAAQIHLDNGTLALTINRAKSEIVSILYRHDGQTTEMCKSMYYSASAGPLDKNAPRPPAGSIQIRANQPARLARNTPDMAEAVMENGPTLTYPFHTETHYLLNRGLSGLYAYQIYSHPKDQPAATIGEARFVLKGPPGPGLYTNHVVDAQRLAPYDTSPIVKPVSDATFLLTDGTIYTKYDNSAFMADHYTHGMTGHGVGVWMLNASNEYVNGGPLKQELTVHADNTLLNMLQGAHYGSGVLNFQANEEWTKLYGPFLVYFNSGASAEIMYKDALARVDVERAQWPYRWLQNLNYPTDRGSVQGQITLTSGAQGKINSPASLEVGGKASDAKSVRNIGGAKSTGSASNVAGGKPLVAANAWVILAAPGGDWPLQGKGYEFWTRTDAQGRFTIPKVRPGQYTLYAVGANQFEQFAQNDVLVQPEQATNLGALKWQMTTHGEALWQIGTPDRSAQDFRDGKDARHFANYLRYAANFPDDVTFTIGKSHEDTDWNYAQWTWYAKRPYWTIRFDLAAPRTGKATFTLGIAASNPLKGGSSNVRIRVNGQEVGVVRLTKSGPAAYRSGSQDSLYRVEYVTFDAALLKAGTNEITLGHVDAQPLPSWEEQQAGRVGAVMYDALRLEVDSSATVH